MNTLCEREDELLESLGRGYIGPELTAHVAICTSCTELKTVAGALLHDAAQTTVAAPVPSAGTMWWRMRIRLQQEALARSRATLLVGQALSLIVAIALVVSFLGADFAVGVKHLFASIRFSTPLLLILGTWVVLAPVAGYVAFRQR